MKYILLAILLVHAVHSESGELANIEVEVEAAQWGCGSSCGCRQQCAVIWWMPCNCSPCPPSCGCCQQTTPTTTTSTTTTTPTTTTTTIVNGPGKPPSDCNGGSCCNQCSCSPCMMPVVWMCPPRCGSGCCGGSSWGGSSWGGSWGGSSCCNSSNRSCCGK